MKASPLAKRIAKNKNIDLSTVTGSGPGGRIVQKDVLDFEEAGGSSSASMGPTRSQRDDGLTPPPEAAPALPQRIATGQTETIELSKMRKTIAKRLQQSKQTMPHFYESIDIELDAAEALAG